MRASTVLMILLAIVFGSAAAFFANSWLASQAPMTVTERVIQKQAEEMGTIVVAGQDFTFGQTIQPDMLREIPWAKANVPDGAFAKIADFTKDGRRVALTSISPNETILKWKVSGPGGRASLSTTVTQGMRAVAVRVDDVVGVAGFVLPGDRVDLLYTRRGSGDNASSTTDVIIQNVKVLAIDQVADEKQENAKLARVITVEVTTVDAQKIALAQQTGSISLTLRSAGSTDQAVAERVVEEELVSNPSVYMAKLEQRDAAQAALEAKLDKVIADSATSKEALTKKLAEVEKTFKSSFDSADKATKDKLAALQEAIRTSDGKNADELRRRLAELEASMKGTPVSTVPMKSTVSIGVSRGTKREVVEVKTEDSLFGDKTAKVETAQ